MSGEQSWLDAAIPNGGSPALALQGGVFVFLKLWARWGKKESRHAYRYPSFAEAGGNAGDFRKDARCAITEIPYEATEERNRERKIAKGKNKRNAKSRRYGEFHDTGTRVCPAYRTVLVVCLPRGGARTGRRVAPFVHTVGGGRKHKHQTWLLLFSPFCKAHFNKPLDWRLELSLSGHSAARCPGIVAALYSSTRILYWYSTEDTGVKFTK